MVARVVATVIVTLAMSAPSWAAAPGDFQIFQDVSKQVLRYPQFSIFDTVHMQVDNGLVTLTGKVTMPYKREEIARRVSRVAGIQRVNNRLEVLPVSQFDDDLRIGIARAIYSNSAFAGFASMVNPPIHVIVDHGRVTLEGVVNSDVDRMIARSIAGSFTAFGLKNELKTEAEEKQELEKL